MDRLRGLQTGNPFVLKLLWKECVENPEDVESQLHEYFGSKHVRGEWFDLGEAPIAVFREAFATCFLETRVEKTDRLLENLTPQERDRLEQAVALKMERKRKG